jgi:hypothetical protein
MLSIERGWELELELEKRCLDSTKKCKTVKYRGVNARKISVGSVY